MPGPGSKPQLAEQRLGMSFDGSGRIDQFRPPVADDAPHRRDEKRIVRASEHDTVRTGFDHRLDLPPDRLHRLVAVLAVALDQFDEPFADPAQNPHPSGIPLRGFAEQASLQRGGRGQNADHAAVRRERRRLDGRFEPHERHGIGLPQVVDGHGRRRIARHDDQLHASVEQPSHGEIDMLPHLFGTFVAVGTVLSVAVIDQRFDRQLPAQFAPDGQPSEARIEDSYRRVVHVVSSIFSFSFRSSDGRSRKPRSTE